MAHFIRLCKKPQGFTRLAPGFTLVEMMVSVAIASILLYLATSSIIGQKVSVQQNIALTQAQGEINSMGAQMTNIFTNAGIASQFEHMPVYVATTAEPCSLTLSPCVAYPSVNTFKLGGAPSTRASLTGATPDGFTPDDEAQNANLANISGKLIEFFRDAQATLTQVSSIPGIPFIQALTNPALDLPSSVLQGDDYVVWPMLVESATGPTLPLMIFQGLGPTGGVATYSFDPSQGIPATTYNPPKAYGTPPYTLLGKSNISSGMPVLIYDNTNLLHYMVQFAVVVNTLGITFEPLTSTTITPRLGDTTTSSAFYPAASGFGFPASVAINDWTFTSSATGTSSQSNGGFYPAPTNNASFWEDPAELQDVNKTPQYGKPYPNPNPTINPQPGYALGCGNFNNTFPNTLPSPAPTPAPSPVPMDLRMLLGFLDCINPNLQTPTPASPNTKFTIVPFKITSVYLTIRTNSPCFIKPGSGLTSASKTPTGCRCWNPNTLVAKTWNPVNSGAGITDEVTLIDQVCSVVPNPKSMNPANTINMNPTIPDRVYFARKLGTNTIGTYVFKGNW